MSSASRDAIPALKTGELRLGNVIANGGFATVFRAVYRGTTVAIKAVPRAQDTQHAIFCIKAFVHECNILSSLSTECVPRRRARAARSPAA